MTTTNEHLAAMRADIHKLTTEVRRLTRLIEPAAATDSRMSEAQHERFKRDAKRAAGELCPDCGGTGWAWTDDETDNADPGPVRDFSEPCPCPEGNRHR